MGSSRLQVVANGIAADDAEDTIPLGHPPHVT